MWPTSRPICFGGFRWFRRRSYPRIHLDDRHHHLRRHRRCCHYPMHHLRDTYIKWRKKCSNKVKYMYISSFVRRWDYSCLSEGQTRIQFFSSPSTHLFIVVESSRIRSSSKGWQMGQVARLGTKGPLAGSLGCRQVMWNEWPQFNLLYAISSLRTVHSGRSQHTKGSGSWPRNE